MEWNGRRDGGKDAGGTLRNILLGFVIGVAALTPGVSGGVIAAAVGLYEPMITALNSLVKDFRRSFSFLFPIGVGVLCGVAAFIFFMGPVIDRYEAAVIFVFLGLVLGSIPSMVHEAHEGSRFNITYLGIAAITFLLAVGELFFSESFFTFSGEFTIGQTVFYGAVISLGLIVPGISTSFLLMAFGAYGELLHILRTLPQAIITWLKGGYGSFSEALQAMNIPTLFWLGIGFLVTTLLIIRLVGYLFSKHRQASYYAVIGFLAGSMVQVFPGFRGGWATAVDIILLVVSTLLSFWLLSFGRKPERTEG